MCTICRSLTATGSTSSTSTPDSTDVKKRSCSETIETEPQPKKHCPISFIFANSRTDNSTVDVILANLTTFAKLVQQQGFEINVEYDRESDVVIRLTQKSPDGCDMRNVILEVENKVKSIKQEQDKLKCISNEFVTGKFKELENGLYEKLGSYTKLQEDSITLLKSDFASTVTREVDKVKKLMEEQLKELSNQQLQFQAEMKANMENLTKTLMEKTTKTTCDQSIGTNSIAEESVGQQQQPPQPRPQQQQYQKIRIKQETTATVDETSSTSDQQSVNKEDTVEKSMETVEKDPFSDPSRPFVYFFFYGYFYKIPNDCNFSEVLVQMGNETDAQISGLKSIKAADESSEQVHTEVNKNVKRKVSIDGNVVVDEPPCKISRPYSFIFANSKDDKCTVDVIVANLKSFVPLAERNGFELSVTSEFSDGINILLKQSSDTCDTKNVILDVDNEVKRMKDYIKTSQCKNNQFVAYEIAKVQTELCSKLNSFEFSQKSAMDNFQQEVTKQLARVEKQMQTRLDDMTAMQLSFQSEMRDNLQKLTEAVSAKTSAQPIAPESVTNLSLFPHSQTYSPLSLIQQPPARQQLLAHAQQHRPRREPMLPTPRTVPHQPVVLGLPCCPPPSNPHHPLAELARRKVKLEPRDMDSDFGANPLYSRHRNHLFPPVKPL